MRINGITNFRLKNGVTQEPVLTLLLNIHTSDLPTTIYREYA